MKWRNHKMVTFGLVYTATGGFLAAFAAMFGAVLPDVLEFRGLVPHRTITHYAWLWFGLCLFFWTGIKSSPDNSVLFYSLFFMAAGALLHVLQDALSLGGVPFITPDGPRHGFGVYKTNTLSEEVTSWGLMVVFVALAGWRGLLAEEYLSRQFAIVLELFRGVVHV